MGREVGVVYLQFTDRHQKEGLALLRKQVARWFPGRGSRVVVVDNAWRGDHEIALGDGVDWIAGDNRVREFTGYEKGLYWLSSRMSLEPETPLVFANDTFHRSYGTAFLRDFTAKAVARGLERGALIGHIDAFPQAVSLEGRPFREWVRTSLFIARHGTLGRLRPFPFALPDEEIFDDPSAQALFRARGALSDNYRDYLGTWLYADPSPHSDFQEIWHSKQALTSESRQGLKEKARCILSEHALSLRASEQGIALYDPARDGFSVGRAKRWLAGRVETLGLEEATWRAITAPVRRVLKVGFSRG